MSHIGEHVKELVAKGKRLDERALDQYRDIKVEVGCVETADGSARVQFGKTDVIVGIKLETGTPYPDTPESGALMVGAELLPMSNPKFEPGPPGIESIELARVIDRGIRESKAVDMTKLCIEAGEKVWMISVDIIPMNADGNLFDAAGLAALAALKNTKFPIYEDGVVKGREGHTDQGLPLQKEPIPVTVNKVGNNFLIDPCDDEEDAVEARITVTSTEGGNLCSLQKGGDASLTVDQINQMIDLALEKAKELRSKL